VHTKGSGVIKNMVEGKRFPEVSDGGLGLLEERQEKLAAKGFVTPDQTALVGVIFGKGRDPYCQDRDENR